MNNKNLNTSIIEKGPADVLYADIFYVLTFDSDSSIRRVSSPLLENYECKEGESLQEVFQVMTPEGNIFEFYNPNMEEDKTIIDPISKRAYTVVF